MISNEKRMNEVKKKRLNQCLNFPSNPIQIWFTNPFCWTGKLSPYKKLPAYLWMLFGWSTKKTDIRNIYNRNLEEFYSHQLQEHIHTHIIIIIIFDDNWSENTWRIFFFNSKKQERKKINLRSMWMMNHH